MGGEGYLKQCEEPEKFSPNSQSCEANCEVSGTFAYENDTTCTKFYTCLRKNSQPISDECPTGTIFESKTKSCVIGKCNKVLFPY